MKKILKKIWKIIDKILSVISIFFIKIYQFTLSPDKWLPSLRLKWKVCIHEPHCSQYGLNTFKRYGFFKWIFKVMDRVLHCTGWTTKIYDPDHYKVVFFSSAEIWIPFLDRLAHDKRFEVFWVVTNPDEKSWRGMEMKENVIKKYGKLLNIEKIATPTKINPSKSEEGIEFCNRLNALNPDFLVVIAYGKIIPKAILDIPKVAPINIHGSILPKYRGASPIQSVLLNNEEETWITVMKMAEGMDTGDMIDTWKFKIPFDWTTKNLIEKMKADWPKFFCDTLRKYGKRMLGNVAQNDSKATYCSKIEKESWLINPFSDTLESIYAKYRAYYLWPKIYFIMGEEFGNHKWKRVIIEELKLNQENYDQNKEKFLINWKKLNPYVEKIILKPEGKKGMDWSSFVQGYLSLSQS